MFKPLLAATADTAALRFPLLASPKIDGIRCLLSFTGPVARSLKPIPNDYIREQLAKHLPPGLDGELLTFTDGRRDDFNTVQSKVMRKAGEPEFTFMVFDCFVSPTSPFQTRLSDATLATKGVLMAEAVEHRMIRTAEELDEYERECVDVRGWEGVMLRAPHGTYKFGRSTVNERILLKVKRFTDDEAIVAGTIEQMENQNEAVTNALGHTERSTAKDGLVPKDTLGALVCDWNGVTFELGTGFSQAQRDDLWARRDKIVGSKVNFKFQGTGPNGKPRFPSFRGMRHDI